MTDTQLGVGVVGAGNWGRNLVRVFAENKNAQLLGVCDSQEAVRNRVKRQYPAAHTVSEFEQLLAIKGLDAVVIAAPAAAHFALAKMALQAGKHTYVEKPLTLRAAESEELVKLADQGNLRLMVGHLLLYHPAVEWIKRKLIEGEFGDIYYIYSTRVNLGHVRSDENALWSLAPHDISVILHLLDADPELVTARGECFLQPGIEDVVFMSMHFPGRKMSHCQVSWLDPHKVRQFTLVGTKRMVVFNDTHPTEKVRVFDRGVDIKDNFDNYAEWLTLRSGDLYVPAISADEPLRRECDHFVQCALQGKTPRTDGRNGLRVVRVLEAASKALKDGGVPVKMPPLTAGQSKS